MELACVYCGETTKCDCPPETHSHEAKFICDVCMALMEEGVPETELKGNPRREETIKRLTHEEEVGQQLARHLEETFEKIWKKEKRAVKESSKKDLAGLFYSYGMAAAFALAYKEAEIDNDLRKRLDGLLQKERSLNEIEEVQPP